jgi:hypothetical protein
MGEGYQGGGEVGTAAHRHARRPGGDQLRRGIGRGRLAQQLVEAVGEEAVVGKCTIGQCRGQGLRFGRGRGKQGGEVIDAQGMERCLHRSCRIVG